MQTYFGSNSFKADLKGHCLTIGNFDGLHLGHRALIQRTRREAKLRSLQTVALTFDPHPNAILKPQGEFERLFDPSDLQDQMTEESVDVLVVEPFSKEFSQLSPEAFIEEFLVSKLRPKALFVGWNFRFGSKGLGDVEYLREKLTPLGVEVDALPPVCYEGVAISSSRIRQCLRDGKVQEAQNLLGRPFYIRSQVIEGEKKGRELGFKTANLRIVDQLRPAKGVYITSVLTEGGRVYPSVCNLGWAPTFERDRKKGMMLEVHIFDFDDNIYGQSLRVKFLKRIRDEKKFSSVTGLKSQIAKDVQVAKYFFKENSLD